MIDQEDDLDKEDVSEEQNRKNRKKMLFIIIPVLIVIGLSVGFYYVFNRSYTSAPNNYSVLTNIVEQDGTKSEKTTVFYDLPEITSVLNSKDSVKKTVKIKLNIELSGIEDTKTIEILSPKIKDAIIAHTIELTPEEISGSSGLYWLKQELLYRINLIVAPLKVNNLNFTTFEIQ